MLQKLIMKTLSSYKGKILRRHIAIWLVVLSVGVCAGCAASGEAVSKDALVEADTEAVEMDASGIETEAWEETEAELETESVTEPDTTLETEEPAEISLVMVGDVLLHSRVEDCARLEDESYDFSPIFANTADQIKAADVAIVNQEVIIGGSELGVDGYPCFNAPYEIGDELAESGFDVICHGTNHALDRKKQGIVNCLNFWQENYPDIAVLGIYGSTEARDEIYVYEQNGIRIAILNYTYGTNGIALPDSMPYAVNLLEEKQVIADIEKAEELADFTIVCPHWGTEYLLETDYMQGEWTKLFVSHGVDLVIGTHPHVIEPIEWVQDEETGNDMLVYYSLGNFVNWTSGKGSGVANRMIGGMAEVTIGYQEDGSLGITDYGVKALVCHLEKGFGGVTTYFLSDYFEELAKRNAICNQDEEFSYEYAKNLCDEVWGDLWN